MDYDILMLDLAFILAQFGMLAGHRPVCGRKTAAAPVERAITRSPTPAGRRQRKLTCRRRAALCLIMTRSCSLVP